MRLRKAEVKVISFMDLIAHERIFFLNYGLAILGCEFSSDFVFPRKMSTLNKTDRPRKIWNATDAWL